MLAAVLAFLASLFGKGSSSPSSPAPVDWQPPDKAGLNMLRELANRAGLTETQTAFLAFVAYGESRWNNLVGLGIPGRYPPGTQPNLKASEKMQRAEARAAAKVYERNAKVFADCGHPPESYGFGSGGWFGFLPATGLYQLRGTPLVCLSPYSVFDPIASLCMAYGFARGLQGWDGYKAHPTVLNLRAMWGWPMKGGDLDYLRSKRPKYEKHVAAMGLDPSFLDTVLPRFPARDLGAMYNQLQSGWAVS